MFKIVVSHFVSANVVNKERQNYLLNIFPSDDAGHYSVKHLNASLKWPILELS